MSDIKQNNRKSDILAPGIDSKVHQIMMKSNNINEQVLFFQWW